MYRYSVTGFETGLALQWVQKRWDLSTPLFRPNSTTQWKMNLKYHILYEYVLKLRNKKIA